MSSKILVAMLMLSVTTVSGFASEPVIGQKDKQFSQDMVSVKPGESVQFLNDDNVGHNISVREPGGVTRPGIVQPVGGDTHISFDKAGDHDIRCLIHPRMKMVVHVN